MTKFNTRDTRSATGAGPITVQPDTAHINHQGGIGYTRDDKSDLYLLATTSLDLTADAFYERGDARVARYVDLAARVAVNDPDWMYRFLTWLRTKGNIRTAALVGGVEAARALVASGIPGGRHMISTVLRRPDEPGEAIAYHHTAHGRNIPSALKRGIGDAAVRLYNERAVLKYDTATHGVRFADVLAITHPTPAADKSWQGDLFTHIIDSRYGRDTIPDALTRIELNHRLRSEWATATPIDLTRFATAADFDCVIADAGMTWENVLPAFGNRVDKATLWRALIPSMGFMARIRNLRNFDEAGLSDTDVQPVLDMLADPDQVRASRQLPLRFLSAHRVAPSLRWAYPLEKALDVSVENIPTLGGRTLILVDTSSSMNHPLSQRSELRRWDAACAFGLALARRCVSADVVSYSGGFWGGQMGKPFPDQRGESLLASIARWKNGGYFLGGGTDTVGAVQRYYKGHDRIVLLTDEQDGGFYGRSVGDAAPADRPLYTLNLAGYQSSHAATTRNRIVVGGLTDAMFPLIAQVESSYPGGWPWVADSTIGPLPVHPSARGERPA